MEIKETLLSVGLNEKEAETYLANLELGKDTAYNIAQKSGIKRPTTYVILESLLKKGLVNTIKSSRAVYFEPVHPKKILDDFQQKENRFRKILPELKGIYEAQPFKPKVQLLEGAQGMSNIYQEIIRHLKTGKELLCIGLAEHFYRDGEEFGGILKKWIRETAKREAKVREIISKGKFENKYVREIQSLGNQNHQIKRCPEEFPIITDTLIFGNKMALFSTRKNYFVILIESREMVQSYKNIFEIMWKGL